MWKHVHTPVHVHTHTHKRARLHAHTQTQQCCTLPVHTAFSGSIVAEQSCKGTEAQTPSSASPENPQPLGVWEGEPDEALPAGGTVESMTQVDFCNKSKGEGFFHPVTSNPWGHSGLTSVYTQLTTNARAHCVPCTGPWLGAKRAAGPGPAHGPHSQEEGWRVDQWEALTQISKNTFTWWPICQVINLEMTDRPNIPNVSVSYICKLQICIYIYNCKRNLQFSFSSKIYRNFIEWIGICFHFVFITAF